MWNEGNVKIPNGSDMEMVDASYCIKVFDKGSKFGINGGRISKLSIKINGKITANYDRGWDIKPSKDDMATWRLYNTLLLMHNN